MLYNSIEWNVFIFIPYFICQKHGENETKLKQEKTFHYASDLNNFTLIILCYELFVHDFISKLLQIWLPMSISKPAPHIKGHKDHLFSHKTYDPQPFFWDRSMVPCIHVRCIWFRTNHCLYVSSNAGPVQSPVHHRDHSPNLPRDTEWHSMWLNDCPCTNWCQITLGTLD